MAYCTAAQVKYYLRITDTTDDDLLTDELIPAVEGIINRYTGRVFEVATATAKTFDAVCDVDDDGLTLYLQEQDLAELTSITNGDGVAIATSSVVTLPRRVAPFYAIRIKSSAGVSWTYEDDPEDAITITGKWGYSVSVPDDVYMAALRLTAVLYKQRDSVEDVGQPRMNEAGVMIMPQNLPKDVKTYLEPYRKLI